MKCLLILFTCCIFLSVGPIQKSSAQCAACKQSAETSLKEGNTDAKGLNLGIMYLLVMPYLLAGGIGYYWYINNKRKREEHINEP